MRFGFETVILGLQIDDLELVLDIIAACGYQGVEFAQRPELICLRGPSVPDGKRPVRGISELVAGGDGTSG
jgi:hypothetical protein